MKSILLLLLFFALPVTAQDNGTSGKVYDQEELDVKADYPDGIKAFYAFTAKTFRVPEIDDNFDAKIVVSFVIVADGSLQDIKVTEDPGYGLGEEALRVLGLSPKWIPGVKDGKAVKSTYTLPIKIHVRT